VISRETFDEEQTTDIGPWHLQPGELRMTYLPQTFRFYK